MDSVEILIGECFFWICFLFFQKNLFFFFFFLNIKFKANKNPQITEMSKIDILRGKWSFNRMMNLSAHFESKKETLSFLPPVYNSKRYLKTYSVGTLIIFYIFRLPFSLHTYSCSLSISLFNGISTFWRLFNAKAVIGEEQWWYYLTCFWWDKGVYTIPKDISPKMNATVKHELEMVYCWIIVQHISHYPTDIKVDMP